LAWKQKQSQSRWSIEQFCEDERPTRRHHRLPWAVNQINPLRFEEKRGGGKHWSWYQVKYLSTNNLHILELSLFLLHGATGAGLGLTTILCPPTAMSPRSSSTALRTANISIVESSRFSSATWKPRRLELYADLLIIIKVSSPTIQTATVLSSFLSAFIEQTDISTPSRNHPTRTI
jgi:hypothetical protein